MDSMVCPYVAKANAKADPQFLLPSRHPRFASCFGANNIISITIDIDIDIDKIQT